MGRRSPPKRKDQVNLRKAEIERNEKRKAEKLDVHNDVLGGSIDQMVKKYKIVSGDDDSGIEMAKRGGQNKRSTRREAKGDGAQKGVKGSNKGKDRSTGKGAQSVKEREGDLMSGSESEEGELDRTVIHVDEEVMNMDLRERVAALDKAKTSQVKTSGDKGEKKNEIPVLKDSQPVLLSNSVPRDLLVIKDEVIRKGNGFVKVIEMSDKDREMCIEKVRDFRYDNEYQGEVIVLARLTEDKSYSRIGVVTTVANLVAKIDKYSQIKIRNNVGSAGVELRCNNVRNANVLLSCKHSQVEFTVPERQKFRRGVVRWDRRHSSMDFTKAVSDTRGILSVQRLFVRKYDVEEKRTIRMPTDLIIVKWEGSVLPLSIGIHNNVVKLNVRPYAEDAIQCYNCYRFGHRQDKCNHPKICGVCGNKWHDAECAERQCCSNCGGSHRPTNKTCPEFEYNMRIKDTMAKKNVSVKEAVQLIRKEESQNQNYGMDVAEVLNAESFPAIRRRGDRGSDKKRDEVSDKRFDLAVPYRKSYSGALSTSSVLSEKALEKERIRDCGDLQRYMEHGKERLSSVSVSEDRWVSSAPHGISDDVIRRVSVIFEERMETFMNTIMSAIEKSERRSFDAIRRLESRMDKFEKRIDEKIDAFAKKQDEKIEKLRVRIEEIALQCSSSASSGVYDDAFDIGAEEVVRSQNDI